MPGAHPVITPELVQELMLQTGLSAEAAESLLDHVCNLKEALRWHTEGYYEPPRDWYPRRCVQCGRGLRRYQTIDCKHCGWLKYPSENKDNWGKVGACPNCGWKYRWDGSSCSHCGLGYSAGLENQGCAPRTATE